MKISDEGVAISNRFFKAIAILNKKAQYKSVECEPG